VFFLLFLTDSRMGHAKIFIGKIWKVIYLEVAGRFTSFLAEKLRTIKAVNVDTSESDLCVHNTCCLLNIVASKTLVFYGLWLLNRGGTTTRLRRYARKFLLGRCSFASSVLSAMYLEGCSSGCIVSKGLQNFSCCPASALD
jgi:hypothetical protein